jgi:5-methylcytosine-specific restriction enzyme subunit McrC
MKTIQIFEHESLTIHKDWFGRQITSAQLEKLWEFNDKNENKFLLQ